MSTNRTFLTPEQRARIIEMKLAGAYSGDIIEKLGVNDSHVTKAWAAYRKENPATATICSGKFAGRRTTT